MGLSSSQARLLNLTARMHDIEYKAQNLEAQKLQMANESTQVYKEYEAALNKQKVQFKQIGSDGSASYTDADLSVILGNGYTVNILAGDTWIEELKASDISSNKLLGYSKTEEKFTAATEANSDPVYKAFYNKTVGTVVDYNGAKYRVTEKYGASTLKVAKAVKQVLSLDTKSTTVLRNLVEAGFIVFNKKTNEKKEDGTYKYAEVNIATDTSLQEVSDETELKKAEAKYEADMRKIDAKDKKFDTDLAAMETERNAIKTEMDTLKTVAKDNVDRTFKLFS